MFGTGKKTADYNEAVETIIGKNSKFKGAVSSQGSIRVDGEFEGEINTSGDVFIGPTGTVAAQIKARNANVAGTVTGNIFISEKLELMSTGKIHGDISVKLLTIEEGAVFKGASQMQMNVDDKQEKQSE